ncbi:hypothetical protein OQX61_07495 [Pedobacter sp. PLR]|uniref:hypothetical protein n=1 Tax=Pedobacter sp. PLR TaxID=2994465 RepID=UPI0022485190|nr:hypothetical protein [Pedobacter sp. PLR]MCX2451113.1 hypothetical protein [Pedobacter sp. PLR]
MRAEIRQNKENNTNLQSQQEIERRLRSGKRVYKNHQRAKLNSTDSQQSLNPAIENMYHVIVRKIKELYSQLPNKEDKVMIEFNNADDPTDSHGLFTVMTPTFFFYLECDIKNNYRIEYLFHNCPLETEIMQLINKYSMASYSTEVVNQPDYPTFFRNCLQVQPSRFIFQL